MDDNGQGGGNDSENVDAVEGLGARMMRTLKTSIAESVARAVELAQVPLQQENRVLTFREVEPLDHVKYLEDYYLVVGKSAEDAEDESVELSPMWGGENVTVSGSEAEFSLTKCHLEVDAITTFMNGGKLKDYFSGGGAHHMRLAFPGNPDWPCR